MNVFKIIGQVAEFKAESARIKVLAFKMDGKNNYLPTEIKQQFKPTGYIFSPGFREKFDFQIDSIIEVTTYKTLSTKGGDSDQVLMDIDKEPKPAGYKIYDIPGIVLNNQSSFNQPILKEYIKDEQSIFYIKCNNKYYGPFKTSANEVIPKTFTYVNEYSNKLKEFTIGNYNYILEEPTDVVRKVDCMTLKQLADYFKDNIKRVKVNIDVSTVKAALELFPNDELSKVRTERILTCLENFSLDVSEIKVIAERSDIFKDFYQKHLRQVESEFKAEVIEPLNEERISILENIRILKRENEKLEKINENEKTKLENIEKDLRYLVSNKERLIEDIKVIASVDQNLNISKKRLISFTEEVYKNANNEYASLRDFCLDFNSIFNNSTGLNSTEIFSFMYSLKYFKCLISNNVQFITEVAKLSNNCVLIIQQVEPDWLKFENLFINGLEKIWTSAEVNKDLLHFFVLEDLNMSSIECYGKPILDLIENLRVRLPIIGTTWPNNLWIFGVPINHENGYSFGLPMIRHTFKSWGFISKINDLTISKVSTPPQRLMLNTLLDHNEIVPNSINDYQFSK